VEGERIAPEPFVNNAHHGTFSAGRVSMEIEKPGFCNETRF